MHMLLIKLRRRVNDTSDGGRCERGKGEWRPGTCEMGCGSRAELHSVEGVARARDALQAVG